MNTWTKNQHCNPESGAPVGSFKTDNGLVTASKRDAEDYWNAYYPNKVEKLTAKRKSLNTTIELTWDADHIHVEKGFEIERKNGSAWMKVASVGANEKSALLTGQSAAALTYRVRATTNAFAAETGKAHAYGPAATVPVAAVPKPPQPDTAEETEETETPTPTPTPTTEASPTPTSTPAPTPTPRPPPHDPCGDFPGAC